MLETIFEWFVSVFANVLEWVVDLFMNSLDFSLETLITDFPILVTAYNIFLTVGIVLTVCIACWSFYQYFFGSVSEIQETPVNILIRAFIAVILIYCGGLVLEWIVDLARLPYEAMLNLNAVQPLNDAPLGSLTAQEEMTSYLSSIGAHTDSIAAGTAIAVGGALAPAAVLLVYLIMLLLVAWNVLRLMVEVCQRFVWVGILVYSSPLAFSTAASKSTSRILKNWFSMFISQCLLMTFSIWTLKLVVSGFTFNPLNDQSYLVRFLMTIAMCKVAQSLDREIQKLGLSAATTGGALIDSIGDAAMAMGLSNYFSGKKGGSTSSGGSGGGDGPVGGSGGIFGASIAAQGVAAGLNAYAGGATKEEAVNAGQKAAATAADTPVGRAESNIKTARYAAATQEAKAGTEAWKQRQATYSKGPSNMSDFQASARATGASAQETAKKYPLMNGSGSAYVDDNGRVQLDEQAKEAGLKISPARTAKNGAQLQKSIGGEGAVVADHIASNYSNSGNVGARYQQMLKDTANQSKGFVSESALMDPTHELRPDAPYDISAGSNGLCSNDTVGSALIENAFGNKATPDRDTGTGYTNVHAKTLRDSVDDYGNTRHGGRVVDANYTDKDGNAMHVRISDEVGYHNMTPAQQAQQRTISGPSGDSYYAQTWSQSDFQEGVIEGDIPIEAAGGAPGHSTDNTEAQKGYGAAPPAKNSGNADAAAGGGAGRGGSGGGGSVREQVQSVASKSGGETVRGQAQSVAGKAPTNTGANFAAAAGNAAYSSGSGGRGASGSGATVREQAQSAVGGNANAGTVRGSVQSVVRGTSPGGATSTDNAVSSGRTAAGDQARPTASGSSNAGTVRDQVQSVVHGSPAGGAAAVGNTTNQTTNNYTQSSGSDRKSSRSNRSSGDNRDRGNRRRDDPNGANMTNTSGRPLKKD